MTTFVLADDLLDAAREIPGTDEYVGLEMTGPVVTTGFFVRLTGVLQARSRSAITCWAQIQSGWPAARLAPDAPAPPYQTYYPAVWLTNGAVHLPASGVDLPATFTLSVSDFVHAVIFPLVRVRWILSAGSGDVLASDWAVVTARVETYRI